MLELSMSNGLSNTGTTFGLRGRSTYEISVKPYICVKIYQPLRQRNQLLTLDLKAINHIMQRTDVYHKPPATREELGRVVGEGMFP